MCELIAVVVPGLVTAFVALGSAGLISAASRRLALVLAVALALLPARPRIADMTFSVQFPASISHSLQAFQKGAPGERPGSPGLYAAPISTVSVARVGRTQGIRCPVVERLAVRSAASATRPAHRAWSPSTRLHASPSAGAARSARAPPPPRPTALDAPARATRYTLEPDPGGPLPPGAQRIHRARLSLLVPGTVLFGVVWIASDVLTALKIVQSFRPPGGSTAAAPGIPVQDVPIFLLSTVGTSIPVLGPLCLGLVANEPGWKTYMPAPQWFLFSAAAAQAVGLVLFFAALLSPETVVRRPVAERSTGDAPRWALLPLISPTSAGVSLALSFP